MSALPKLLQDLRNVTTEMLRESPRLVSEWLDRVKADLDRINGVCPCGHKWASHVDPGGCCVGACECLEVTF